MWFNERRQLIDFDTVSTVAKAMKYSMKHTHATQIEIRQIRGNWKRTGEYLLGLKRENGKIDWQRVPSDSAPFSNFVVMEVSSVPNGKNALRFQDYKGSQ